MKTLIKIYKIIGEKLDNDIIEEKLQIKTLLYYTVYLSLRSKTIS